MNHQRSSFCFRTTNPLKINHQLFSNYLNTNISDCILSDAEILDVPGNTNYTHIIYVATWANLIKGQSKDGFINMSRADLRLDCPKCKLTNRHVIFKVGKIARCSGYNYPHAYPGSVISTYEFNIHEGDKKIFLSMWKIGITWKPFKDVMRTNCESEINPVHSWSAAHVNFWCTHCIYGGLLKTEGVSTKTKDIWSSGRQYCHTGPIASCEHVEFDEHIMIPYHFRQPFVNCLEITGNHNEHIIKIICDVLQNHVPIELASLIVDFSSGLWFNLTQNHQF